jgi:hypothetical protein
MSREIVLAARHLFWDESLGNGPAPTICGLLFFYRQPVGQERVGEAGTQPACFENDRLCISRGVFRVRAKGMLTHLQDPFRLVRYLPAYARRRVTGYILPSVISAPNQDFLRCLIKTISPTMLGPHLT